MVSPYTTLYITSLVVVNHISIFLDTFNQTVFNVLFCLLSRVSSEVIVLGKCNSTLKGDTNIKCTFSTQTFLLVPSMIRRTGNGEVKLYSPFVKKICAPWNGKETFYK